MTLLQNGTTLDAIDAAMELKNILKPRIMPVPNITILPARASNILNTLKKLCTHAHAGIRSLITTSWGLVSMNVPKAGFSLALVIFTSTQRIPTLQAAVAITISVDDQGTSVVTSSGTAQLDAIADKLNLAIDKLGSVAISTDSLQALTDATDKIVSIATDVYSPTIYQAGIQYERDQAAGRAAAYVQDCWNPYLFNASSAAWSPQTCQMALGRVAIDILNELSKSTQTVVTP